MAELEHQDTIQVIMLIMTVLMDTGLKDLAIVCVLTKGAGLEMIQFVSVIIISMVITITMTLVLRNTKQDSLL